jgi:glutaredoxin
MLVVMNEHHFLLITAADCHLCARARDVLASLSLTAREIDVRSVEAGELAGADVPLVLLPVLWDGERVLAYGRFSERALRRRLAA